MRLSTPPLTPIDAFREHYRQFLGIGHLPSVAMLQSFALWLLRPLSGAEANAFWLRLPSALWSALTVIPLIRLGALLAGRTVGIMTGIMFALFFFPVFYGREVYYYAGLVMFTAFGLHGWFSIAASGGKSVPVRHKVLTTLALGAMASAHVSGVLVSLALLAPAIAWVVRLPKGLSRASAWSLVLIPLLGSLTCIPFFWQRLQQDSPMKFAPTLGYSEIIRDAIGKQFFGIHTLPFLFACALILCGLAACLLWHDGRRHLRIGLVAMVLIASSIIAVSAHGTLYFPRYFNAINGALYIIVSIGLFRCLGALHARGGMMALGLTVMLALASAFAFLPTMYALPAKGVNYGGISRTLSATFKPGTPFVMESGYEMRFTPGYFPTPGLIAACPYLHGDVHELWARQRGFFERFPEAVYVESAHHGSSPNETYGIFEWPRKHFRQRIDVVNEPLARLARLGIWPAAVDDLTAYIQSHTSIYYNTPADNDAVALAEGKKAVVEYPGWKTAEIQQHQYARIAEGHSGTLVIRNLTTDYVTGELEIPVGLMAPSTASINVELLQEGISVGAPLPHRGGSFNTMMTGLMRFKPGANIITIRATSGDLSQLKAIVIPGCNFKPR